MGDRDDRIRDLLRRGVPKSEIARRLRVTRGTVSRVGAAAGFPARRRSLQRHDWPAIRSFYEAGHSAAECKRRFQVSDSAWRSAICRGDIRPRPRTAQRPPGERRRAVSELLDQGLGVSEIAQRLGISKPTVCYHARRLGVPSRAEFARRFDWEEISRAYESGVSMRDCRTRFGFSTNAWSEAVKRGDVVPRSRLLPIETLLVVGRRTSRTHLKARLLAADLKENRCERCGVTEWNGQPLVMQLHHKNGDGTDNRLGNLELLCGNCHSQTPNYGGRNGHRRPSGHGDGDRADLDDRVSAPGARR